jgi:ribosomal protein S18 acetylase RimI-like enzyme
MSHLIDYSLTPQEILQFPFICPYGLRHIEKPGWLNKLIGVVELFPILGPIVALIERTVYSIFQKYQSSKHSVENPMKKGLILSDSSIVPIASMTYEDFNASILNLEKTENANLEAALQCFKIPKKITLTHSYDYHSLEDRITEVSDKLSKINDQIKEVWKKSLETISKIVLIYPDDYSCEFNTTLILKRLEGKKPEIKVELLSLMACENLCEMISQIVKIERECFVSTELISRNVYDCEMHKQVVRDRIDVNQFFIARDITNNNIVGVLEYDFKSENIFSIGRSASYSKSGIGGMLWKAFLSQHPHSNCTLNVRENNPAKQIYKKWGFEELRKVQAFYTQPSEAAIKMRLNVIF